MKETDPLMTIPDPATPADCSDLVFSASTENVNGSPVSCQSYVSEEGSSVASTVYPVADFYEPVQWMWNDTTFEVLQAVQEWSKHTSVDY